VRVLVVAASWAAAAVVAAVAGCRAMPSVSSEDLAPRAADQAVAPGDDLAVADDMAMCPVGPEICNNGCDDDRNGYTDGDDPACTTQMLVTLALPPMTMPEPSLQRLLLGAVPRVAILDGNPIPAGGMSALNRAFSSSAYVVVDGNTQLIRRLALDGGYVDNTSGPYARDVCIFNGELIVVQAYVANPPPGGGWLHRFKADAQTEILPPIRVPGHLSACTSDGVNLYVSRYNTSSEIVVLTPGDPSIGPVLTSIVLPMPTLPCCDRLIDFTYVPRTGLFIGLFAAGNQGKIADNTLDSAVMAPFWLDGGLGPPIDAGSFHGVGEFRP
jgi:hypothetical protein